MTAFGPEFGAIGGEVFVIASRIAVHLLGENVARACTLGEEMGSDPRVAVTLLEGVALLDGWLDADVVREVVLVTLADVEGVGHVAVEAVGDFIGHGKTCCGDKKGNGEPHFERTQKRRDLIDEISYRWFGGYGKGKSPLTRGLLLIKYPFPGPHGHLSRQTASERESKEVPDPFDLLHIVPRQMMLLKDHSANEDPGVHKEGSHPSTRYNTIPESWQSRMPHARFFTL